MRNILTQVDIKIEKNINMELIVLVDSGIYKITCIENNKIYIGQSKNIKYRFGQHLLLLRKNTHFNRHLQFSFDKYGEDSFKFEVIEYCDKDKLTERESYWINKFGGITSENLFNVQDIQEPFHFTEDVRKRISEGNKR